MVSISRPPRKNDGMGFIEQFGSAFGTKEVKVTPGHERPGRGVETFTAVVTSNRAQFNVDTPIFEGDTLEWADPRGGTTKRTAAKVNVNDTVGEAASLAHINVHLSETSATKPATRPERSDGHVIVVNGSNVNIALEGATITQQVPVSAGYEALADAVGKALAIIEETASVDPDEVEYAREAATVLLEESAKPDPDQSIIKRALPTIRGVLTAAASSGAGAAASGLVAQLFA